MQLKNPVFNHKIKCFRTYAKSNALSNKKQENPPSYLNQAELYLHSQNQLSSNSDAEAPG